MMISSTTVEPDGRYASRVCRRLARYVATVASRTSVPATVSRVVNGRASVDPQNPGPSTLARLARTPGAPGPLDGVAIAADGKTFRGAKGPDGSQVHLLAAMTHDPGLVLAQTDVGAETNEVPRLRDLLSGLSARVNLRGAILTVDALHAVRETARWLHGQGIEFVMTVNRQRSRTTPS